MVAARAMGDNCDMACCCCCCCRCCCDAGGRRPELDSCKLARFLRRLMGSRTASKKGCLSSWRASGRCSGSCRMQSSTNSRSSMSWIFSTPMGGIPWVTFLKICAGFRHSLYGYSRVASSMMHSPNEYTSTFSVYCSSYNSGAINSGVPMTLIAALKPARKVAKPRSPILIVPLVPLMKILSDLRSRWIMGGLWPWRYTRPWSICHAQRLSTVTSMLRCLRRYVRKLPSMKSSVMKMSVLFF
mmetsp:Transcript_12386/g.33789  ORF Transcript_12386/g.33789 Transcript_12386/m.33789 type:complete len:242 (-) Transcript_12386:389-1114(-)